MPLLDENGTETGKLLQLFLNLVKNG